eukprot:765831-Hanusia_phi.AAC.1
MSLADSDISQLSYHAASRRVVIHTRTKTGLIRRDKSVTVTFELLEQYFHLPQAQVASTLVRHEGTSGCELTCWGQGVSLSSFKVACRKLGLDRWPYDKNAQRAASSESLCTSSSSMPRSSSTEDERDVRDIEEQEDIDDLLLEELEENKQEVNAQGQGRRSFAKEPAGGRRSENPAGEDMAEAGSEMGVHSEWLREYLEEREGIETWI